LTIRTCVTRLAGGYVTYPPTAPDPWGVLGERLLDVRELLACLGHPIGRGFLSCGLPPRLPVPLGPAYGLGGGEAAWPKLRPPYLNGHGLHGALTFAAEDARSPVRRWRRKPLTTT
jgi:hypothetical protein